MTNIGSFTAFAVINTAMIKSLYIVFTHLHNQICTLILLQWETSKTKIVWYKMPWPRKKEKVYLPACLRTQGTSWQLYNCCSFLHNYS